MKKNNFLNGLTAKIALAVVALTTTMFTSCSNEDIEIDVTPVNAKAIITPVVFANGQDVTTSANITYSTGNGTYEGTTIAAQTVTVTATYNNLTGSTTVDIPTLTAAQVWTKTAIIILSYSSEDLEAIEGESTTKTETISKEYTYDNPSDYWYEVPVTYTQKNDSKVVSSTINTTDKAVKELIDSYNIPIKEEKITKEYPVYAHSRLAVKVESVIKTTTYTILQKTRTRANETVLATFIVEETTTAVKADGNKEIPGHGHAPAGHGHGHAHGGSDNAGGGIIIAD